MTDHRTRLASREPMTVEEEAEELLRRQRAGLIREVDVGPCSSCPGDGWGIPPSRTIDLGHKIAELIPVDGPVPCPACNGTGRRYRSGLELAAYCGHEAARLALGHVGMTATLRYARTDEDAFQFGCLLGEWGDVVAMLAADAVEQEAGNDAASLLEGVEHTLGRLVYEIGAQRVRDSASRRLIRWALTEP